MKTESIIFDLDGTLLDTIDDIADSMNKVLNNYNFPEFDRETYKQFVGEGSRKLVNRVIPESFKGDHREKLIEAVLEEYNDIYSMHWADKTRPYEGIRELLAYLNKINLPIFILSNKDNHIVKQMVLHFFQEINFTEVLGAIAEAPKKPDPTQALLLLKKYNYNPINSLMIGDSKFDVQMANNAGINSCGVLWGFRSLDEIRSEKPTHIAKAVRDIYTILN